MTHILITGCNRGIGHALAVASLARGWRVTGTTRGTAAPDGVSVVECDMDNVAKIAGVFEGLGPLDILVNNAGVFGPESPVPATDYAGFRHTLTVNTVAPLAVTEACLPALRQSTGARVLSVSSQMSSMGYRKSDRLAYRASKVALNKVMQGVATALEPEGIACALIDPGWVRTDMGGPDADEDVHAVAEGILTIADRLNMADTGKFFRFTGEERAF